MLPCLKICHNNLAYLPSRQSYLGSSDKRKAHSCFVITFMSKNVSFFICYRKSFVHPMGERESIRAADKEL